MEKFTIAERYTNKNETPIEVGDKIKIISSAEFKAQNVKFHDQELLEKLAGNFYKVEKIEHWAGVFLYYCTDVDENEIPIQFVDSDIEYVLR